VRKINLQLFADQGVLSPTEGADDPEDIRLQDVNDEDGAPEDVDEDLEPEDEAEDAIEDEEPSEEPEDREPAEQRRERRSHWKRLQKSYRETQKRMKEYEQVLDDLASLAGVDRQTLLQQLELAKIAVKYGQPAQRKTQQALTQADGQSSADYLAQAAFQQSQEALYNLEAVQLKQDPLYSDIDKKLPTVKQVAQRYGISLKQAYNMLYADEVAKRAERRALENAKVRSGLSAERDYGVQEPTRLGLDEEEFQAAIKMGYDPRVYAALKEATNIDEYERLLRRSRRK